MYVYYDTNRTCEKPKILVRTRHTRLHLPNKQPLHNSRRKNWSRQKWKPKNRRHIQNPRLPNKLLHHKQQPKTNKKRNNILPRTTKHTNTQNIQITLDPQTHNNHNKTQTPKNTKPIPTNSPKTKNNPPKPHTKPKLTPNKNNINNHKIPTKTTN